MKYHLRLLGGSDATYLLLSSRCSTGLDMTDYSLDTQACSRYRVSLTRPHVVATLLGIYTWDSILLLGLVALLLIQRFHAI